MMALQKHVATVSKKPHSLLHSLKVQTTVQPVFVSRKINQNLKVEEKKPRIIFMYN